MPGGESERRLRALIVKVCHALARRGLVAATDGNVSARLGAERFLITPSGIAKGELNESQLLTCDAQGQRVPDSQPADLRISSEVRVHLAAYRHRPQTGAVVHAHPPLASAFTFSGMERHLALPVIPEVVAQLGPIPTVPYFTPGSQALAEQAGPYFASSEAVLLALHGAVTLGSDPWQAYLRMEKLEHAALILKSALELAACGGALRQLTPAQLQDLLQSYQAGSGG